MSRSRSRRASSRHSAPGSLKADVHGEHENWHLPNGPLERSAIRGRGNPWTKPCRWPALGFFRAGRVEIRTEHSRVVLWLKDRSRSTAEQLVRGQRRVCLKLERSQSPSPLASDDLSDLAVVNDSGHQHGNHHHEK